MNKSIRNALCLAAALAGGYVGGQEAPRLPADAAVTLYHGVPVADPYRPLEDLSAPATKAWVASQAARTRATLDALPGLKPLLAHIEKLDAGQAPAVFNVQTAGKGAWFYLKRVPGENVVKLYTRPSMSGPERLLLDPEAWQKATGKTHAINEYAVSPDGRHVAAIISQGDAELGELAVFDTVTGKETLPRVAKIWGELRPTWTRGSRTFQYARGGDVDKPGGMAFGKMQLFERRLDGKPDRKLFGFGEAFGPEVREKDWVFTEPRGDARFTFAILVEGVSSDARVMVSMTSELDRDPSKARWVPLLGVEAGARDVTVFGRYAYIRSHKDASRLRILRVDATRPGAAPVEVVPQQAGVIDAFAAAADGLYFVVRTGALNALYWLPHTEKPGTPVRIAFPFAGAANVVGSSPLQAGVPFTLEGWARERTMLFAANGKAQATALIPASGATVGSDWVAEEVHCKSHDGAMVPMSVLYRKGLVRDGRNPVILDGYGGYGFTDPASFSARRDAWLARGGVYAMAEPRGSGAYGHDWYQAAVGPTKPNTWKDMIACGETLVAMQFTTPAKLAIQGTSMGGVAVGRSITERPDLFAAALVRVGMLDAIRIIEATPNGPNHELEMGNLKDEKNIRQLLAMSTYHQIRDGEKYPATLFTTGENDSRVAPWQTYKTFARMAAATASGRPVLLRVETDGGHGVTTTAKQRNLELADRLAFVLWVTGDKDFQPVK